jgi:leucyl-tRNA synthetase
LAPFAPFITDELYCIHKNVSDTSPKNNEELTSIHLESWVEHNEELAKDDAVTIVIQINGKLRGSMENILISDPEENIESKAMDAAAKHLEGREIVRAIYVPGKLVNFVVKDA